MAGREDAKALFTELDGLSTPNSGAALASLKTRGFPSEMNGAGKPSYFDSPSTDQEKKDKSEFVWVLSQFIHRKNGD